MKKSQKSVDIKGFISVLDLLLIWSENGHDFRRRLEMDFFYIMRLKKSFFRAVHVRMKATRQNGE